MPGNNSNSKSNVVAVKRLPLTTKKAVELLLSGGLKHKVCRYCLHITYPLSELDQIMQLSGNGALYKVAIRDIVASFHPFKVADDPNFPNKICEKCLNQAIRSYLFAQQCEKSERALRNCYDDIYEKFEKLDPIEYTKKRGRQKLHPNYNVLHAEHQFVTDYAEPIRNLINVTSASLTPETPMGPLECKKCWQILPDAASLANHEKIHPKNMWFHCRLCGKSISKKYQMKRHVQSHGKGKSQDVASKDSNTDFVCKQCGYRSKSYDVHLQHIEKHKFKMVLEHLVHSKMDKLCAVCLDKNSSLIEMDKIVCLHGGYPELTGDRTLYNILGSTIPEMNILQNYTGTKICTKCLDYAIISYVFVNRTHYIRNRLNTCVTNILENIKDIKPESKMFIEIVQNGIMPITETYDESLLLDENEVDETKLKVDVLEDEFRLKSEDESTTDDETPNSNINGLKRFGNKTRMMNGYNVKSNNLNEFLKFNKKKDKTKRINVKYTCPVCDKKFISDYYLRKHVIKHANKKVTCQICWRNFRNRFYLNEHMKFAHILKLKSYSSCQTCGRTFKNECKKLKHEKSHKNIFCDLCSKTLSSLKSYENHIQKHASKLQRIAEKSVQNCSFCEKECSNDNKLSVHVNKVHLQIKPYSCDMCDKQFYTEQNLKCHKKAHMMLSKEKCEFCSKLLKCRRDLVVHIRQHLGIKPYKCVLCMETFYSDSEVKKHMKKWHGGSFCCKLCRKVFVTKKGLKDHVNTAHSIF